MTARVQSETRKITIQRKGQRQKVLCIENRYSARSGADEHERESTEMSQKIQVVATGMAVVFTFGLSTAMAIEGITGDVAPGSGGFVGLGVAYTPDYEGSDEYEAFPIPFGAYHWQSGRYVELGGTAGSEQAVRLKANVIADDMSSAWQFGPLLQYRLKRDDVENTQVDNMKEVDGATEAGAFVGFTAGLWSVNLSFAGDVSDEHDGYLVYLDGSYSLFADNTMHLSLDTHITYADSNYMETYFGVDVKNVGTSGLSNYKASSGIKDAGLALTGSYAFSKTWGIIGNVSYTRMLNDAEDSPLVNDEGTENQLGALVAVSYAF